MLALKSSFVSTVFCVHRNTSRSVYAFCGAIVLLAFVMTDGDTSIRSMWPYYSLFVLCVIQLWRPTLFVWFVLLAAFMWGLVIVITETSAAAHDRVVFAVVMGVPTVALWWFRPGRRRKVISS